MKIRNDVLSTQEIMTERKHSLASVSTVPVIHFDMTRSVPPLAKEYLALGIQSFETAWSNDSLEDVAQYMMKALEFSGNHKLLAETAHLYIAQAKFLQGKTADALKHYNEALTLSIAIGLQNDECHNARSDVADKIITCHLLLGSFPELKIQQKKVLETGVGAEEYDHHLEILAHCLLAAVEDIERNLDSAIMHRAKLYALFRGNMKQNTVMMGEYPLGDCNAHLTESFLQQFKERGYDKSTAEIISTVAQDSDMKVYSKVHMAHIVAPILAIRDANAAETARISKAVIEALYQEAIPLSARSEEILVEMIALEPKMIGKYAATHNQEIIAQYAAHYIKASHRTTYKEVRDRSPIMISQAVDISSTTMKHLTPLPDASAAYALKRVSFWG